MYECNEQRGNVKPHQQGIPYAKMYFEYSGEGLTLTLRILSCYSSYSCGSRACLPLFCVERDSSREVVVNVNDGKHANAMPGVTQSAYTKPSLPAATIAFFPPRRLCFVQPHLCWYLSRQRGHKKPRACLKEESFTIIYINKNRILPLQ